MEKSDKLQIHFVTRAEGGILKRLENNVDSLSPFFREDTSSQRKLTFTRPPYVPCVSQHNCMQWNQWPKRKFKKMV